MATLSIDARAALRAIRNLYCLAATAKDSGHKNWIDWIVDKVVTGSPDPIRVGLGEFLVIPKAVEVVYEVLGEKVREWWHTFRPQYYPTIVHEKLKSGKVEFLGIVVVAARWEGGGFQVEIRRMGTLYVSPSKYAWEALRIVELASQAECRVGGDA